MNINDVDKIVPLFKKDHEFYHATSNINDIKNYLLDRVKKNESVIYYVEDENKKTLDLTNLHPLLFSLEMKQIWLLYDLHTMAESRCQGTGTMLLNKAEELAKETESEFITLSTVKDNYVGQKLYKK